MTRHRILIALTVLLVTAWSTPADAQRMEPMAAPSARAATVDASPLRLVSEAAALPLHRFARAEEAARERLEGIAAWNRAGRRPTKIGFHRRLPVPVEVTLAPSPTLRGGRDTPPAAGLFQHHDDRFVWATEIAVDGAWRLRLGLEEVELPAGTEMWVYAPGGNEAHPFGLGPLDEDGNLWTPSVGGERIALEVSIPETALGERPWRFSVSTVSQMFPLDEEGAPIAEPLLQPRTSHCLEELGCVSASDLPSKDLYSRAVAHYHFNAVGGVFVCSGTMIANEDVVPYMLTANHCVSKSSEASSMESWFHYVSDCGATLASDFHPDADQVSGATLMATSTSTDFTLVRLPEFAPNTVLAGWIADDVVGAGTTLDGIHHPNGWSQHWYRIVAENVPANETCDLSRSNFILSGYDVGSSSGGSSGGSIVVTGSDLGLGNDPELFFIVGQLFGCCGFNCSDVCDFASNREVHGRFSTTYQNIGHLLGEGDGGDDGEGECPAGFFGDPGTFPDFCFRVEITPPGQDTFEGTPMDPSTCIDEAVCVAGALEDRAEVFLRIVGPKPNGFLWPTLVKFSTSQIDIRVHQLSTGEEQHYVLAGASPGSDELEGLFDRDGFEP